MHDMKYLSIFELYNPWYVPLEKCETGKICYPDKKTAETQKNLLNKNIENKSKMYKRLGGFIKNVYLCKMCGNWHLTTTSEEEMMQTRIAALHHQPLKHLQSFQKYMKHED
jgi:hypothetical protein